MMRNARKYIRAHRKVQHWLPVVACLAVLLLLGTAYALILPAITMEPQCGLAEHAHTESCYTQVEDGAQEMLTCTETHEHGARCYGTWVATCGMEEHIHTDDCLPATAVLSAAAEEEIRVSLLYGDGKPQSTYPDGVFSNTTSTMAGYLHLEPGELDNDPTDVTVMLTIPKQYVDKSSVVIPSFSTNSHVTEYEILPVTEEGENYRVGIHFLVYDKTQTLVLPFTLKFRKNVVPDDYRLLVTASISGQETETAPNIYRPQYKEWNITKFVNSNRIAAFSNDGAEAVVSPLEENGNPYLDDRTYVDFSFIVNGKGVSSGDLDNYREASGVTLTDVLPQYTDKDGNSCVAVFDAEKNPGWTLADDGLTVSKTYIGASSEDVLMQIYNDALHLRFPGLRFTLDSEGIASVDLTNTVRLSALPSNASEGETRPSAEDDIRFRVTDDPVGRGSFGKSASKGDIYDVGIYKTNPYPWSIGLSNARPQPLQHIIIQDRKIEENGKTVLEGLDEALKFVRLESNLSLPEGTTAADIVNHVTAYYTDGTVQTYSGEDFTETGNFTIVFDEAKICDGYEIVFRDDYKMYYNERAGFTVYTLYRDPEHTHVPNGGKITYRNVARSVNSYEKSGTTEYVYLKAAASYNMLPSTENLWVSKDTMSNNANTNNSVGSTFTYLLRICGSMLEPEEKEYQDLRLVDLLPEGIEFVSVSGFGKKPAGCDYMVPGGWGYKPEIVENYHNSGRTAVIFHLNAKDLPKIMKNDYNQTFLLYTVKITENAKSGTARNYVYLVGDNLDEYRGNERKTADIYDLNNNGRTDDQIAYAYSDAVVMAAQSIYAEKSVAPAGSDDWSSQTRAVKLGSDFDYQLKVVNGTSEVHTGLVIYDTLPELGDTNGSATMSRGSEFPVRLRGAITPPEGYSVRYTTSPEVYRKSMSEMLAADIWTDTPEDYSEVTAFLLTADEGTVLDGKSTLQLRVPARAAQTLSAESLALLADKTYEYGTSCALAYLSAANSFSFHTDQLASAKESDVVRVRIPFAGFWMKKVDARTGNIVSGAEFTLTDEAGNTVQMGVTDEQGCLLFRELPVGSYTLTETKTPDGYFDRRVSLALTITQNPITLEYTVTFDGGHTEAGTSADPLIVENDSSYELPQTGGMGTGLFYGFGLMLLLTAALLALRKRRRAKI